MLLEHKIVPIPAQVEMDADQNEFGELSTKTRAAFGAAAVEVGTPDRGQNDDFTDAVDTLANIFHWLDQHEQASVEAAIRSARMHFEAEKAGEA